MLFGIRCQEKIVIAFMFGGQLAFTGTSYTVPRTGPGAGQGQLQTLRGWRVAVGVARRLLKSLALGSQE